jgi:arylsulfatase A-like enzyme
MVEALDMHVGRVLAALDQAGVARNTIVIFTNDNGGEWLSDNTPLFHRKWTTWEGGIRVPAIVRWPGHIRAGTVTPQVGITMDLTASVLGATRTTVPADVVLDGLDLFPTLTGATPVRPRTLFWRSVQPSVRAMRAVRDGDRKLVIEGNHTFLFDVRRDPGERNDLARVQPAVVRALKGKLDAWEREVDGESGRRR